MTAIAGVQITEMSSRLFVFSQERFEEEGFFTKWWTQRKTAIPELYKVAKRVGQVVPSEAGSERNFKDFEEVFDPSRSRLHPDTAIDTVMVSSHVELIRKRVLNGRAVSNKRMRRVGEKMEDDAESEGGDMPDMH